MYVLNFDFISNSLVLMTPIRMQVDGHSQTDLAFEYYPSTNPRHRMQRSISNTIRSTIDTSMSNVVDDDNDPIILAGLEGDSFDGSCGWILSEILPTRYERALSTCSDQT